MFLTTGDPFSFGCLVNSAGMFPSKLLASFILLMLARPLLGVAHGLTPEVDVSPRTAKVLCGPHCVYLLLRLNDVHIDYNSALRYTPRHPAGMSMVELRSALADFGLNADIQRITIDDLQQIRLPVIACVNAGREADEWHFVIFLRLIRADKVEVIDGTSGKTEEWWLTKLPNVWEGMVIVPNDIQPSLALTGPIVFFACIYALIVAVWFLSRRACPSAAVEGAEQASHQHRTYDLTNS